MGSLYRIFCRDCGYDLELRWGVGMLFMDSERLPAMLPKQQGNKVREMMDRPDRKDVHFNHQLYSCPGCKLPASRLNYTISFENGEVYQPSFRCSNCWTKLVETEDFSRIENCPACGSINLIEGSGDWD